MNSGFPTPGPIGRSIAAHPTTAVQASLGLDTNQVADLEAQL